MLNCEQHFFFHISVWINYNRISEGLLYLVIIKFWRVSRKQAQDLWKQCTGHKMAFHFFSTTCARNIFRFAKYLAIDLQNAWRLACVPSVYVRYCYPISTWFGMCWFSKQKLINIKFRGNVLEVLELLHTHVYGEANRYVLAAYT
jgi:hypothetical protein